MTQKWRCRVFWGNPHTIPPNGRPRIVLAVLCDRSHPIPAEVTAFRYDNPEYGLGTGWATGWERIDQRPVRRWSQEARARVRKRNLRRRIEKKFPLFAEDFIAAEMSARPSYYEGSNERRP